MTDNGKYIFSDKICLNALNDPSMVTDTFCVFEKEVEAGVLNQSPTAVSEHIGNQ